MNESLDWELITIAALIAGLFNLPVAFQKLRQTCKGLLFFEPLKSPGFWLWILAQLLFPSIVFLAWITNFFSVKPVVDAMLFLRAIAAGFGFTAFLNSRTETGFLTLDIKSLYDGVVRVGFALIASQETRRTKTFLRALEKELHQPSADMSEGLRSLRAYFSADIALTLEERQKFLGSISQALSEIQIDKQIEVVENLLPEVRQRDLVDALEGFKCSPQFLQTYLPRRFARSITSAASNQALRL
ncbi:hypothetical protein C7B65_21415 [Phormidesmis priestleyi ULC007]|uniref:Uncharacterized protein n=1 Tax=Phormidesmis priestleyi ULC007 TaxID=1920490 RepID=A0A2T1D7J8_9CYAN|nr:hypothetical protein [Phormidesmis priestleyi]PSB16482.1 hypothetical protein C7B65_21415 [Phormidesmis priestleyi ULC007]PZO48577.1 MAG: hypothetical protein DCF14_16565 [Phormidesmis priestleyi]